MLSYLARPFAYLTIRHPDRRPVLVNWVVPAVVAAAVIAATAKFAAATSLNESTGSAALTYVTRNVAPPPAPPAPPRK